MIEILILIEKLTDDLNRKSKSDLNRNLNRLLLKWQTILTTLLIAIAFSHFRFELRDTKKSVLHTPIHRILPCTNIESLIDWLSALVALPT